MSVFDNYKLELQKAMEEVCAECGLFQNSLQFNESTSKKMSGYKIQIFEEEYPTPSELPHEKRKGVYDPFGIALIKEVNSEKDAHYGSLLVYIKDVLKSQFAIPSDAEMTSAPPDYFGFYVTPDSDALIPYLKELMRFRIRNYRSSSNSFGCCSAYNVCSDAKRCVHYNLLYATACIYRIQHLEKGEFFYGKNRTID